MSISDPNAPKLVDGRITMNTVVNVGLVITLVTTALNVGAYQERVAQTAASLEATQRELKEVRKDVQALREDQIRTSTSVGTILGGIARIEARLDGKEKPK